MKKVITRKTFYRRLLKLLIVFLLFLVVIAWNDTSSGTHIIIPKSLDGYVDFTMTLSMIFVVVIDYLEFYKNHKGLNSLLHKSFQHNLLKITEFLFSAKIQKEIFEPITVDWHEEYFEALFKKEIWKARWMNMRYTYAFFAAMWQKSPIGDLIEFVNKIAKP